MFGPPVIALSFALSFLGFGFLWIGKLSGEAFIAVLYLLLAYTASHFRGSRIALRDTVLPALPLALLIGLFRDSNDSHLGSIAIVLAWLAGAVLGAFAADRARTSLPRLCACIGAMSVLHLLVAGGLAMASFGSTMRVFEGQPVAPGAGLIDSAADLLMQPMLSFLGEVPRLTPVGQWIALAINSLAWGSVLGVLLALALRAKGGPAPAPAG